MNKHREECLWDAKFIKTIKSLAPGTPLREGLDNIIRAKMGALIVIGDSPSIMQLVDGGFRIDSEYTPAGFYELAKMDGALVLSGDTKRILYANAQLIPDAAVFTSETGTRHRSAERMARQTGSLVIAISQRRNIITLYLGDLRYTLKDISTILSHANQALQALAKYKAVLSEELDILSVREFAGTVTLNDVITALIRAEQVNRIARGIERDIIELGQEGQLVSIQVEELMSRETDVQFLIKDYCSSINSEVHGAACEQLANLPDEYLEPYNVCRILGYGTIPVALDIPVIPRGYRALWRVQRLPMPVVEHLVDRFKTLYRIYNASLEELDEVEGVGGARAKAIKEGLKRVKEQALLGYHA